MTNWSRSLGVTEPGKAKDKSVPQDRQLIFFPVVILINHNTKPDIFSKSMIAQSDGKERHREIYGQPSPGLGRPCLESLQSAGAGHITKCVSFMNGKVTLSPDSILSNSNSKPGSRAALTDQMHP